MGTIGTVSIWLCVLYLLVHSLLISLGRKRPRHLARLLVVNAVLILGFFCLVLWASLALRLWLPIVFFWWAYTWAGHTLNSVHPPGYLLDAGIIQFEERHLGHPSLCWARSGRPWVTEIMHVFYFTYYLYTPVLGAFLHWDGRFREFEAMALAVLTAYAVSYVCFAFLPTVGPRWALVDRGALKASEQRLEGYWFTRLINSIMYGGPALKGGAMPSSHSSTAVVFLLWCWRLWGAWGGLPALVIVVGMWAGSIYGRYHYVLDIVCGALLGLAAVWFADAIVLG